MLVFEEGGKPEYPEKNPRSKDKNDAELTASMILPVILRPWFLVRSGFEPATSRTVVWCSTN